jgi:predicted RNA-binding protein with PIN domain
VPLVRILVDGYSLLHSWPELARGKARHSAAARDELIHVLRQYRDAVGTPLTIVFDGQGPAQSAAAESASSAELEILYSKSGQTADDIIERVAVLMKQYGEVMVVTNDFAERDTVVISGGMTCSCEHFIGMIEERLRTMKKDLAQYNRRERQKFKNSPFE